MRNLLRGVLVFLIGIILISCDVRNTSQTKQDDNDGQSVKTYTVTFNSDGGTEFAALTNVTHGSTILLPTPLKDGFIFKGWYTGEDSTSAPFHSNSKVTSDITLYARWDNVVDAIKDVDSSYTYRTGIMSSPTNINPHIATMLDATSIYEMITAGLFSEDFDWGASGVTVGDFSNAGNLKTDYMPYLANEMPIDVNGDGKTWQIKLRQDITWENGEIINADDYIYSWKMLIDPNLANNNRTVLTQDLGVVNADEYVNQGQSTYVSISKYMNVYGLDSVQAAIDHAVANNVTTYINYYDSYQTQYIPEGAMDAIVETTLNAQELHDDFIIKARGATEEIKEEYFFNEVYFGYTYQDISFEEVGIKKIDQFTIQLELLNPIDSLDLRKILSDGITGPVYQPLYETFMNEDRTYTDYGTSIDTIMSYGPFVLDRWEQDIEFLFKKNNNFIHADDFRFDYYSMTVFTEGMDAIIDEFKAGNLDVTNVFGRYYIDFNEWSNLKNTPTSETYPLATNIGPRPDGKTNPMMAIKEFRQALYYAIDRQTMATIVSFPANANQGLISPKYVISDWSTSSYRATPQGISVFENLYPETTGYNADLAKQKFNEAYAKAVSQGIINDGDKVWVELAMQDTSSFGWSWSKNDWVKDTVEKAFDAQVGGTNYGRFEFRLNRLPTSDLLEQALDNGNYDLTYGGWSGVESDPIKLMGYVYNSASDSMVEKGWNTRDWQIEVDLPYFNKERAEGTIETLSFHEWFLRTEPGGDLYEAGLYEGYEEDLLNICAAIEAKLIEEVLAIPLYTSANTVAYSERVVFEVTAFHPMMGWGGLKYMYLNTSDNELVN